MATTIRIAGINHFDPRCRQNLLKWYHELRERFGEPCFVATEWDEKIFSEIKAQREQFLQLARQQWPQMTEALICTLTRSLGYEGDTQSDIFPDSEVLWLDQGRRIGDLEISEINEYAQSRLNMYREFLGEGLLASSEDQVLETMSQAATRRAPPPSEGGDERDRKFAALILQRITKGGCQWAIAIVGKNHASDTDGSMRRLLENAWCRCEIVFL